MIVPVKDILFWRSVLVDYSNMWQNILQIFIELLYPYTCIFCKQQLPSGETICPLCAQTIPLVRSISPGKMDCEYLDGIFLFTKYHEGTHNALQKIKFGQGKKSVGILANFMEKIWQDTAKEFFYYSYLTHSTGCSVIPIPTDAKRQAKRGYDLPTELFQNWCAQEKFHWQPILKRLKYTQPQFALNKTERRVNVHNSMELIAAVDQSIVILVDDIFTTGATMNEAARILQAAGVKKIIALAFSGDYEA